jgi:glyoxylate/hydroxypyruvate reductase A
MRLALFVADQSAPRWVDAFKVARPQWHVVQWREGEPPTDFDYAAAWAPSEAFLRALPPIKALMNLGAGVDAVLRLPNLASLLGKAKLIRLNDAGMASQMAEYVCHALAREARGFAHYEALQQERQWKKSATVDKSAWPVGVMGIGSIGRVVAEAVARFDYPVHGWSRTARNFGGMRVFNGRSALNEFLAATRVLVLALPLTPDTRGIIDAKALSMLRHSGLLINIGRGALIDEAALLAALHAGHLQRAVLDVFDPEPLPLDHAFWAHPKVTLTPHVSGVTLIAPSVAQIVQKIDALERGESVDGVVDLSRGY